MNKTVDKSEVTNGGETAVEASHPYRVQLQIQGACDMLMHRWNPEAVDAKAKAAKNSVAKKTDDIETYVYRNEAGELCLPGEYLRQSICMAAKFRQDPRSPRKSAHDLYKAGVQSLTQLAGLGTDKWHYEDRRRCVVQRQGINRTRPAMREGWKADFQLIVLTPEYISPTQLHEVTTQAGALIGVGDFRPTFGRFIITNWEVLT